MSKQKGNEHRIAQNSPKQLVIASNANKNQPRFAHLTMAREIAGRAASTLCSQRSFFIFTRIQTHTRTKHGRMKSFGGVHLQCGTHFMINTAARSIRVRRVFIQQLYEILLFSSMFKLNKSFIIIAGTSIGNNDFNL